MPRSSALNDRFADLLADGAIERRGPLKAGARTTTTSPRRLVMTFRTAPRR
jgi:hypothetical protein